MSNFSPREIVQLLWTENLDGIYDAMQEKIWACAQCYTCAARCPFENSPGGLIMLMRETAIKHGMQAAKNVLRPFSRLMFGLGINGVGFTNARALTRHFRNIDALLEATPEVIAEVPGVGPIMAQQIYETLSEDSMRAVPQSLRQGSLALGANRMRRFSATGFGFQKILSKIFCPRRTRRDAKEEPI